MDPELDPNRDPKFLKILDRYLDPDGLMGLGSLIGLKEYFYSPFG